MILGQNRMLFMNLWNVGAIIGLSPTQTFSLSITVKQKIINDLLEAN